MLLFWAKNLKDFFGTQQMTKECESAPTEATLQTLNFSEWRLKTYQEPFSKQFLPFLDDQ